jgi:hypothetical protein
MGLPANTCPRCLGGIPNDEHRGEYPGAQSRYDNKTEVCSACGADEAMREFTFGLYRSGNARILGWPLKSSNEFKPIPAVLPVD